MENKSIKTLPKVKIATIIAYSALVLSLLFLFINSPATGYEISIYSPIPVFWAFIFIAISIAIALLVYLVYNKNYEDFWHIFLILILSFIIIFTLPITRGYYLYGSSDLTEHYTRIVNIVSSGNFIDNYYPISHILGAEMALLSQIPTHNIVLMISPIFSFIFILFTYYLARSVFNREDYSVMAAALSFIPLYSYYHIVLYPHSIAIFLLPLVFYLYFNSKVGANFKIIFIVMIILEVFVHVIPALIIFVSLVSAEIVKIFINRINTSGIKFNISFSAAIISIVTYFVWWSSFSIFGQTNKALYWLIGESSEIPRLNEVSNVANQGQQVFIELFLKMYGSQLVLTILTLITIVVILIYYLKRKEDLGNPLILSVILISSALTYVLYFFASGFASFGRFFGANYGVWAMPVIIAFLFAKLDKEKIMLVIITIIISLLVINTLNIYRSDWILQPNWQVTNQDILAKKWQDVHGSRYLLTGLIGSPWGTLPTQSYKDSIIYYGEIRQKLVSDNEIISNSTVSNVWGLPGFNDEDFVNLKLDNTVNFIYSNGEIKILLVKSKMPPYQ